EIAIGRKVAIIGGGNAAIDSARSALRKGAEATVFYRRERKDMPAIEEETKAAREEGAKFVFLAAPHRVIGDSSGNVKAIEIVKTRLGEYDTSGRKKPVLTDEIQRFECDAVIFAVGESVDLDFARASGLSLKESGTIEVNRFSLESSRPRFYAGGDVITGASNVSNAMAYGKLAASTIDQQLMETRRWEKLFRALEYGQIVPESPSPNHRHTGHILGPGVRVGSNAEVVTGFTHEEALDEACRCLRCDLEVADVS
ncbi:MAG: FAD-dependent oxidoreductase, partial [Candidatus Acidiferrum sp.]